MTNTHFVIENDLSFREWFLRELHTVLVALNVIVAAYLVLRGILPEWNIEYAGLLTSKYIGPSWWFFAAVGLFIVWVVAALIVQLTGLGVVREWRSIDAGLHWAFEASPIVGLLATFIAFLTALLAYADAGPGKLETQQAFIEQFAIAFGSSICGGIMALIAFTLEKVLPRNF